MHPLSRRFAQIGALAFVVAVSISTAQAQSPTQPRAPRQAEPPPPAEPAPPQVQPPTRTSEVAGRYAVLREARDTGCMVTLSTNPRSKGFRAQLAPACRDQGIVVFDPVGWWLAGGKLHLQARKGHNIALGYEEGVWAREGERPLGLKKI